MNHTQELYRFEDEALEKIEYLAKERSLAFLDRLVVRICMEYETGFQDPRLVFGKGVPHNGEMYSYTDGPTIVLAPGQRNVYTLLHEMTHFLGPSDHGYGFKALYFHLLDEYTSYNAWFYYHLWLPE